MNTNIIANDKEHLQQLINKEIELNGNNCDLNHINTSNVNDMGSMFADSKFNRDISQWNVSKVTNMNILFYNSQFNQDVSKWKPYSLEYCLKIFDKCSGPVPYWLKFKNELNIGQAIKAYDATQSLQEKLPTKKVLKIK